VFQVVKSSWAVLDVPLERHRGPADIDRIDTGLTAWHDAANTGQRGVPLRV
jgi:hypothetical protein